MKAIKAEIVQLAIDVLVEEFNLETDKYTDNVKHKVEAEISDKKRTIRKLSLLAERMENVTP